MMPLRKIFRENRGQALAETALILGVLLFIIFVMVESARLFQANLTVQNAAREAGRYAITGDFDPSCLSAPDPCADPRVASIRAVAEEGLTGLQLDPAAGYDDPRYYWIDVLYYDDDADEWIPNAAGGPGDPVMVRVTYRVGILTPFVNAIARTVRVSGQVVFNNEEYNQYTESSGSDEAPDIPPPPTIGPSPTPRPPDLQLTMTGSPNPAIQDQPLEYVLFVQNEGDADATGVTITDTLPPGVTVADDGGCSGDPILTCDLGTIPAGGSASVTIRVVPQAAAVANSPITNSAEVAGNEFDPDTANNKDSVETEVVGPQTEADLEVRKTASSSLVAVGDSLIYNVVVINHGLATALATEIADDLPGSVTFVAANTQDAGDTCTHSGEPQGGTVTCQLGDMLRDQSTSIAIEVEPKVEGDITNSVTVSSNSPEPASAVYPNTASVDVTVENAADLGVTKNLSPNPGVGERITYTVSLINNGPADATGVGIVDSLPPEVTFLGFGTDVDNGRCAESGNVVTCNIGNVADGAADFVRIVVRPNVETVVTNYVEVSRDQRDPYTPNDSFELSSEIEARADVDLVSIVDRPDPVDSGDYLDYIITILNHGPSETDGVRLEERLPPESTFVSASASQGTCGLEGEVVSCNLGLMEMGDRATVRIRVIPILPNDGFVYTRGNVTAVVTDPNLTNNAETANTFVNANTFMTLDPICGPAGTAVTVRGYNWTINANEDLVFTWDPAGPDPAADIHTYTLPSKTEDVGLSWTQTINIPQTAGWRQEHTIQATSKFLSDEAIFEVPCPAPDLEVLGPPEVVTPTTVMAGDTVTFTVNITNSGDLDAINQFFVGLYFDPALTTAITSTTHISQEYRVGFQAISSLAAGSGRTLTYTIPAAFDSAGPHTVYAVVDSDPAEVGLITTELLETNNVSPALALDVEENPDATPVPEYTPTATPSNPGGLNGIVFAPAPNDNTFPQQGVEVFVITDTGTIIASDFTNNNGEFFLTGLEPASNYTMLACIELDGIAYADSATGITVTAGIFTRQDFLLEAGVPCVAP